MKWSERRCPVRRSRVCESREQEEEAFALQAAVTSGRVKVLLASIAPSVIHGIGVKGFAPPPQPAFFRRCSVWIWWWSVVGTIQRWKRWPGVRKSGGTHPIQGLFQATLSRQARDGMRRPLEPTGARSNRGHDLVDPPHRLVFHKPHHHQQAQLRVHVTPHAIANSPSFEGETSRLLPIAIQRCPQARSTEPQVERGSDRAKTGLGRAHPSVGSERNTQGASEGARVASLDAHMLRGRGYDINPMCPSCEQDLDTPFHRVWA